MIKGMLLVAGVAVAHAAVHPFAVQMHDKESALKRLEARHGVHTQAGPPAKYFPQFQDHFDGANVNRWQQAYFMNDTFYKPGSPVFLCVGGEGPALTGASVVHSVHCNNAVEFLQEKNAIMFAVEHRYYGCHNRSACPVEDPNTKSGMRYLSSRQALADLAQFRSFATKKYALTGKWISFGGSYPGMLAGWFRLKFPHLVHGSIASSAPVKAQVDMVGYNDVVAEAYSVSDNNVGGSPLCHNNIATGHATIGDLFKTEQGRERLASLFGRTPAYYNSTANQAQFAGNGVAQFPAQSNDPNCEERACNIKKICVIMTESGDPVDLLAKLVQQQAEWSTPRNQLDQLKLKLPGNYWGYQTCAEFGFYQTCEIGSGCMYTQGYVTVKSMEAMCRLEFTMDADLVQANVDYTNEYYGADKPAGSCVLYPNGEVDPWHALSINKNVSAGIQSLWVPGASHHAWTHPSTPQDQASVIQARQTIRNRVSDFLSKDCNQPTS